MILQVVIDGQYGYERNRLVRHRRHERHPVHWNCRREQKIFWNVQRLAQHCTLNLACEPCESSSDCSYEKDCSDKAYARMKRSGHALHSFCVARYEQDERIPES